MKAPVTIPLTSPVIAFGVRHDALTLRTPKRRDIRAVAHGSLFEAGTNLMARLAGVPVAVILNLSEADAERVGEAVKAMLDREGF